MSTFGALVGATVAGITFRATGQNYIITFALASVPALAALLLTISVSVPCLETRTNCMLTGQLLTRAGSVQAFGGDAAAKAAAKSAAKAERRQLKDTEIPGVKGGNRLLPA